MPPTRDALGSQAERACHGPRWVTAASERRPQQLLKPHLLFDIPAVLKKLPVPQPKVATRTHKTLPSSTAEHLE